MKPQIAIVGPGAMGCLFGAYLARAGNRVRLLARRPEHARVLCDQGIVVHKPGESDFAVSIPATVNPAEIGRCDLVLILVKAYDTAGAAKAIAPAVSPGTPVLTLQNGLGNIEQLAGLLPSACVLAGTTGQGANLLGPGVVHHAGEGETLIGQPLRAQPGSIDAEGIAEILSAAGLAARTAGDAHSLLWGKLLINVGINALTAILRVRNGQLLELELAASAMRAAVAEATAVAHALGVTLPYDDPWEEVARVARLTAANRSSMLQDVERGRRTEVGQINGAVVSAGSALGVATPVNAMLTRLVQCLEQY